MAANERIKPRPLTLGHLAVELATDRRTIAAALREAGAEPAASHNGHPAFTVRQALAALARRAERVSDQRLGRFRPSPPETPPWLAAIDEHARTPFERGFCLGVMRALYELPRVVAGVGVRGPAALAMGQAFEVTRDATLGLLERLFEGAREAGVAPFAGSPDGGPEIVSLTAFVPVDWRTLAAERGETGWEPPGYAPGWNLPALDDDGQPVLDDAAGDGDEVREHA
jgi:hypothetical protein